MGGSESRRKAVRQTDIGFKEAEVNKTSTDVGNWRNVTVYWVFASYYIFHIITFSLCLIFIINIIAIIEIAIVIFNNQENLKTYLLKLYHNLSFNLIAINHFHFKATSFTFIAHRIFSKVPSFLQDISYTNLAIIYHFINFFTFFNSYKSVNVAV